MVSGEVTARPIVVARVALGDGTGCVARRPDGLVFAVATDRWQGWAAALDAFVDAANTADAIDALLVEVVDAGLVVDPFVVVHWSTPGRALVFGDVDLTSDMATLGRLSGVGSGGWVEHPFNVPVAGCVLRAGAEPQRPSRHEAGIVAAGGFRLDLQLRDAAEFPEVVEVPLRSTLQTPPGPPADAGVRRRDHPRGRRGALGATVGSPHGARSARGGRSGTGGAGAAGRHPGATARDDRDRPPP